MTSINGKGNSQTDATSNMAGERGSTEDNAADLMDAEIEEYFNLLKNDPSESSIHLAVVIQMLSNEGIMIDSDLRLAKLKALLHDKGNIAKEKQPATFDLQAFKRAVTCDGQYDLVTRAFSKNLVIPNFAEFAESIRSLYELEINDNEGEITTFIPELKKQDPKWWAVSVCTVDGQQLNLGDWSTFFTLQSSVKPFMYALALELLGKDVVHKYVGQESSNQDFNAITLDSKGRPYNPMVNAGAIVICSLLQTLSLNQLTASEKYEYIFKFLKRLAGDKEVRFNNAVFISERETACRNKAITHFMKAHDCFPTSCDVSAALDLYFQSCSMEVTSSSLSAMCSTLANGGVCPFTNERVISTDSVRCVLSLMQSCGMYNLSGEFAHLIGIPGKAGVSGSVCLVVPGLLGIGMFSPRINEFSCSNRAYEGCKGLMRMFAFHPFEDVGLSKKNARSKTLSWTKADSCPGHRAAVVGDSAALATLVDNGYKLCRVDQFGRTALHVAAAAGQMAIVRYVIENCLNVINKTDVMGQTALDDAKHFGHNEIIKYLESWATVYNRKSSGKADRSSNKKALIV